MNTLESSKDEYLVHCTYSKSLSANTIRAYDQDISDFCRFAGPRTDPSTVTSEQIASYLQTLSGHRKLSAATARRRMACLKCFFSWLQATSAIERTPFADLRLSIKLPRRLPRTVTRHELKQMTAAVSSRTGDRAWRNEPRAPAMSPTDPRTTTYLAIMLMAATGIRVGELVRISPRDIDLDEGRIRIHGKGSRERTVFVANETLTDSLRSYLGSRRSLLDCAGRLLLNSRGRPLSEQALRLRLRKLADKVGLERRITPHMLRHTAATLLLEEGVDIRFVQRLLGHQCISTTEIYTHVTDTSLRAALLHADPIGRMRL